MAKINPKFGHERTDRCATENVLSKERSSGKGPDVRESMCGPLKTQNGDKPVRTKGRTKTWSDTMHSISWASGYYQKQLIRKASWSHFHLRSLQTQQELSWSILCSYNRMKSRDCFLINLKAGQSRLNRSCLMRAVWLCYPVVEGSKRNTREKSLNSANQHSWFLRVKTSRPEDLPLGSASQFCCIENCFNLSLGRTKVIKWQAPCTTTYPTLPGARYVLWSCHFTHGVKDFYVVNGVNSNYLKDCWENSQWDIYTNWYTEGG